MARSQGVRSLDLRAAGIVDVVVPELPDAADEAAEFCRRIGEVLQHELELLRRHEVDDLVAARMERIR